MSKNNPLCKVGDAVRVDLDTGETVPIEGGGFRMLPPPPDKCQWCAADHEPGEPHNQQSMYYRMKFQAINGRSPTWTDAMAHCDPIMQEKWRTNLVKTMQEFGMEIPEDLSDA